MQLQSKGTGMSSNNHNNVRLNLVIAITTIVLISPFVYLAIKRAGNNNQSAGTNEYYDPGSGETVSDPAGRTHENFGGNAEGPVYLGFSKLLGLGVTKYQLEAIKFAFEQFGISSRQKIEEVSITLDTLRTERYAEDDPNPKSKVYFDVTVNRKVIYKARVEYFESTAAQLYLSDPKSGRVIYDSKVIDLNNGDNYGGDGTPPEARTP